MILTVTLNAAIDKVYRLGKLSPGEVNRVVSVTPSAGGKGLNVSRVARLLGAEVLATGMIGGRNGQRILDLMKEEGLKSDFLEVPIESRICLNIIDDAGVSTELLEPGDSVDEENVEAFITHFKTLAKAAKVITLSGSGLKEMPKDIYSRLVEVAGEAGKPVILDSSGEWLSKGLQAMPTLIKPNRDEMIQLAGSDLDDQALIDFCRSYIQAGIRYVVVSLGSEGALLVSREGSFRARPPRLEVVNTVGSGDAMVAGLSIGLLQGSDPGEMLRRSVAVSAANTLTEQTGFVEIEEVERLYQVIRVERIGE